MNGYLVIGLFTVILAITLYWLQGRQAKIESRAPEMKPAKKIEVVKARDWPVTDEKKVEPSPEKVEEKADEPIEKSEEVIPVVVESESKESEEALPVEEKDIALLSGVGPKYRSLLKEVGITTINQVALSEPKELQKMLFEVNKRTSITKRPPNLPSVKAWIEAARSQLA